MLAPYPRAFALTVCLSGMLFTYSLLTHFLFPSDVSSDLLSSEKSFLTSTITLCVWTQFGFCGFYFVCYWRALSTIFLLENSIRTFTRKLCSDRSFHSGYPYTIMSKLQVVLSQSFFFFFFLSRFLLNALLLLLLLSCFSCVRLCAIIELLIVAFTFKPHFYYWLLNAAQLLFSVNSFFLFFCYEEINGLEGMCFSRFIPIYTSPVLITF